MSRYPQVRENEWVQPVRRGYRMACCDCGLVHEVDFRVYRGRVQLRARRNARATALRGGQEYMGRRPYAEVVADLLGAP